MCAVGLQNPRIVIPAQAGIHSWGCAHSYDSWIPAFAGMTESRLAVSDARKPAQTLEREAVMERLPVAEPSGTMIVA